MRRMNIKLSEYLTSNGPAKNAPTDLFPSWLVHE